MRVPAAIARAVLLFPGAHDVYPQHTSAALRWFTSEVPGAAAATPTPKSALDNFFKNP